MICSSTTSAESLKQGLQQQRMMQTHMMQQTTKSNDERAPFGNVASAANSTQSPAAQKKTIALMEYRAAPVMSPFKEAHQGGEPVIGEPVIDFTQRIETPLRQPTVFAREDDPRIAGMHDRHGHLDPNMVQSYVDEQISSFMSDAYAEMGQKIRQAAQYKGTTWQTPITNSNMVHLPSTDSIFPYLPAVNPYHAVSFSRHPMHKAGYYTPLYAPGPDAFAASPQMRVRMVNAGAEASW